ncbi:MAG: endolytic transglycosylase MltG, partial [Gammaproteobacteria bacterium]|nr:endolytic transglycosylase MltG [Gammaproteobacteria bacterium]
NVLEEEWSNRPQDTPLQTAEEVLTLASIIEKETSVEDERNLVAAVFVTRLKRDMRLQTDPTVIYGLGDAYDGNIRRKDLKTDTPYNTYVHKGLPPTPIALPSRASIAAALHPADSEVLFFVSKGDGTHHFSKTYEEHREAVIKYQLGGKKDKYQADHKSN